MRGLLLTGREFLCFSDSEHEHGNKRDLMVPPGCCGYLKEVEIGVATAKMAAVVCRSASPRRIAQVDRQRPFRKMWAPTKATMAAIPQKCKLRRERRFGIWGARSVNPNKT